MDHFELHSEYQPTGDQPQAIKQLVEGFKKGNQFETLDVYKRQVRCLLMKFLMASHRMNSMMKH